MGILTSFDLSELIRDEQSQKSVIVRVDGDVERDELVEEDQSVDDCRQTSRGQGKFGTVLGRRKMN